MPLAALLLLLLPLEALLPLQPLPPLQQVLRLVPQLQPPRLLLRRLQLLPPWLLACRVGWPAWCSCCPCAGGGSLAAPALHSLCKIVRQFCTAMRGPCSSLSSVAAAGSSQRQLAWSN